MRAYSSLKPGFTVITDISNLIPLPEEVRAAFQEMMKETLAKGMSKVVRVPGDAVVTSNQFQRTSRSAGYTAQDVYTVAEAEKLLAGSGVKVM